MKMGGAATPPEPKPGFHSRLGFFIISEALPEINRKGKK